MSVSERNEIVLGSDRWRHRLIINELPPPGVDVWTEEVLRAQLGERNAVNLFGELRDGYFLAEFVIAEGGGSALLSFDFYDLEGVAEEQNERQNDEGDEQGNEERPNDGEGEGRHD